MPVPATKRLRVSVVWTGFIRPASTKSFTFYLSALQWAQVIVDNVMIMSNDTVMTASLSLSSTSYYILEVDYNNTAGSASINLQWMDTSIVTIPASNLFYMLSGIPITGALISYTATQTSSS